MVNHLSNLAADIEYELSQENNRNFKTKSSAILNNKDIIKAAQNGHQESIEKVYNAVKSFIYFEMNKFASNPYFDVIEFKSSSGLSFTKALKTYDVNSNIKFITYFGKVLVNDFLILLRHLKCPIRNSINDISLYEEVNFPNSPNETIYIIDTLESVDKDLTDDADAVNKFINLVLNLDITFEGKYVIFAYAINQPQWLIAKDINLSQSYVSRLRTKVLNIFKEQYLQFGSFIDEKSEQLIDIRKYKSYYEPIFTIIEKYTNPSQETILNELKKRGLDISIFEKNKLLLIILEFVAFYLGEHV